MTQAGDPDHDELMSNPTGPTPADSTTASIDPIRAGLHEAGWYARADIEPAHVDGIVSDVLDLIRERLTSPEMVSHVQNWVPLGYDYPARDPYPNIHVAAQAILAETADALTADISRDDDDE